MTRGSGLAGNAAVLSLFGLALGLEALAPERYAAAVQEDEALEWASFWAFALAAVAFAGAARERRAREGRHAWLTLGTALFCVFVAGEEISWGQRLLGYRPPEYFLASNFQQELNLHNLVETRARKWTLMAVIAGFGVVLPLAARMPALEGALGRLGAPRPPLALAPAFAATLAFYLWYPVRFSGEWVETALGVGFLLAGADEWLRARAAPWHPGMRARPGLRTGTALAALAALLVLGAGTARGSRALAREDPARREAALREAEALRRDFAEGVARGRCGIHKRLYTFVEERRRDGLYGGAFARTAEPDRAAYFLDPWNSPWWIRHACDRDGRSTLLVYSFGPNRRRDSHDFEVRGDDVGARLELAAPPR